MTYNRNANRIQTKNQTEKKHTKSNNRERDANQTKIRIKISENQDTYLL